MSEHLSGEEVTALCIGGPHSGEYATASGDTFVTHTPQPGPDADGLRMIVDGPPILYVRHESPRFGTLWALRGMTAQEIEAEYLRLRALLS